MKPLFGFLASAFVALTLVFTACEDSTDNLTDNVAPADSSFLGSLSGQTDTIYGDEYIKVIVNPIVELEDCDCPVSGTVEIIEEDEIIAVIDFGDGECDGIVTVTEDGETYEMECTDLDDFEEDDCEHDDEEEEEKYEEKVVEEIVIIDGCDCPVSGVIEYYLEDELVAVVDFGNGECDDVITITEDGETYEVDCEEWEEYNEEEEDDDEEEEKYEEKIVEEIVIIDGCDCPVSGVIEYYLDDELVAVIDFGDGECDGVFTKTVDGETYEIDCEKWKYDDKDEKYEEKIVEDIVKMDGCECPVSGIIEYYLDGELVAILDYGDGECDNLATITKNGETVEFELEDCE